MSDIKPFEPKDVLSLVAARKKDLPTAVVTAVNELLVEAFAKKARPEQVNTDRIEITQEAVVTRILAHSAGTITRNQIFDDHLLDFETLFKDYGWNVVYHKAHYTESHDSFFTFQARL